MTVTRIAGLALAAVLGTASPAAAETIAHAVFEAGFLKDLTAPASFHYRYEMSGETIQQPIASQVVMDVREVKADGSKIVHFDMFDGQRQAGPMEAREQNLVVLAFLQRDVTQMANLTGGAAGYFQQQIRRAFNDEAVTDEIEIELGGRTLRAQRLVIKPFAVDPNISRFPRFKDKSYEFVVAQDVPGGIYRIATLTPGPASGKPILAESITFAEVRS